MRITDDHVGYITLPLFPFISVGLDILIFKIFFLLQPMFKLIVLINV